jgi:hypothetical protein
MILEKQFNPTHQSVFTRVLWLYGLYSLLNMGFYLFGYYLLPEGFMRGGPQSAVGEFVASATSFCTDFAFQPRLGCRVKHHSESKPSERIPDRLHFANHSWHHLWAHLRYKLLCCIGHEAIQCLGRNGYGVEYRRAGNAVLCACDCVHCRVWNIPISELVDIEGRKVQKLSRYPIIKI